MPGVRMDMRILRTIIDTADVEDGGFSELRISKYDDNKSIFRQSGENGVAEYVSCVTATDKGISIVLDCCTEITIPYDAIDFFLGSVHGILKIVTENDTMYSLS